MAERPTLDLLEELSGYDARWSWYLGWRDGRLDSGRINSAEEISELARALLDEADDNEVVEEVSDDLVVDAAVVDSNERLKAIYEDNEGNRPNFLRIFFAKQFARLQRKTDSRVVESEDIGVVFPGELRTTQNDYNSVQIGLTGDLAYIPPAPKLKELWEKLCVQNDEKLADVVHNLSHTPVGVLMGGEKWKTAVRYMLFFQFVGLYVLHPLADGNTRSFSSKLNLDFCRLGFGGDSLDDIAKFWGGEIANADYSNYKDPHFNHPLENFGIAFMNQFAKEFDIKIFSKDEAAELFRSKVNVQKAQEYYEKLAVAVDQLIEKNFELPWVGRIIDPLIVGIKRRTLDRSATPPPVPTN